MNFWQGQKCHALVYLGPGVLSQDCKNVQICTWEKIGVMLSNLLGWGWVTWEWCNVLDVPVIRCDHPATPVPWGLSHHQRWTQYTFYFKFFGFFFLVPHPWHMGVPKLAVKSDLSSQCTPQPQQGRIRDMSVTYPTAHGNARCLTHWARPELKPSSSQILVRVVSYWAMKGTPQYTFEVVRTLKLALFLCDYCNSDLSPE